MLPVVHHIQALREQTAAWRQSGEKIALVPTMGNLHTGHLRLVEEARRWAPRTIASIFVNPMQFGPHEDFTGYPRTLAEDQRQLEACGLDLLFAPNTAEVYSRALEALTKVEPPESLTRVLCGISRSNHFTGVATVVAKLFNMTQPDIAVFGEKDWQQLVVIRRMTADLNLPVEIIGVPTVREPDGLAMSSRNNYLSPEERAIAPNLYQTLQTAAARWQAGERDYPALEAAGRAALAEAGLRPDYFAVRRAEDLARPSPQDTDLRIFAAVWLGKARLIDNVPVY